MNRVTDHVHNAATIEALPDMQVLTCVCGAEAVYVPSRDALEAMDFNFAALVRFFRKRAALGVA